MARVLVLVLVLIGAWSGNPALAGAWPRGKGETFLAVSAQIEGPNEFGFYSQFATFYLEYGLGPRLTGGLDLGGDGVQSSKAVAFLRWPLLGAEQPLKLAVAMGAGRIDGATALRPEFSLGRGLRLAGWPGWANADARLALFDSEPTLWEAEFTLGLSPTPKFKTILQLQTGGREGQSAYARLAPSLVIRRKKGRYLEFGVTAGLQNAPDMGVKIGTWREF